MEFRLIAELYIIPEGYEISRGGKFRGKAKIYRSIFRISKAKIVTNDVLFNSIFQTLK
jgi:hypothetical protein